MSENKMKFEIKTASPVFKTFTIAPHKRRVIKNISKKFKIPEKITHFERKKDIKFLTKKTLYFKVESPSHNQKKKKENSDFNDGRWTKDEQMKFLKGISLYGNNWKKVKSLISTRNTIQVRSHAQKFINKMKLCKDERLGLDFTSSTIHTIKDMINQIKSINSNYALEYIFNYLSEKCNKKMGFRKKNKNKHILIQNEPIIDRTIFINLEENKDNSKNNDIIRNFLGGDLKINTLEKTEENNKSDEQINKFLRTNFIPPNNDIKFNDINNITNNLNHIILNNNNTFLNSNNNFYFFGNTLNNIIQLNNFYNNFFMNNYINYNNNLNDGFLLGGLFINNANIPFSYTLPIINSFNSLKNQNLASMADNSNNNI